MTDWLRDKSKKHRIHPRIIHKTRINISLREVTGIPHYFRQINWEWIRISCRGACHERHEYFYVPWPQTEIIMWCKVGSYGLYFVKPVELLFGFRNRQLLIQFRSPGVDNGSQLSLSLQIINTRQTGLRCENWWKLYSICVTVLTYV